MFFEIVTYVTQLCELKRHLEIKNDIITDKLKQERSRFTAMADK